MPDREPQFLQDLPMQEMINFFRDKINVPTERYDSISEEAHKKAFAIAGLTKADMLNQFRSAVDDSITKGESLEDFRKKFDSAAANWDYRGGRDWRSWIIYDTNLRRAYAEGLERRMQDPSLRRAMPYAIYLHGNSAIPRPEHLSYHNKILPIDDPWWQQHNPPIGFGCSCIKKYLTRDELPLTYKITESVKKNAAIVLSLVAQSTLASVLTKIPDIEVVKASAKASAKAGAKVVPQTVTGEVLKASRKTKVGKASVNFGNIYDHDVIFSGQLMDEISRANVKSSPLLTDLLSNSAATGKPIALEHLPIELTNNILDELRITQHKNLNALIPQPPKETLHVEPVPLQLDELYQYAAFKQKQHPIPTVAKNLDKLAQGGFTVRDLENALAATGKLTPNSVLDILFKENSLAPAECAKLLEANILEFEAKSKYFSHLKDFVLTNEKLINGSGDIFIIKTTTNVERAYRMVKGKRVPMPIGVAQDLITKGLQADRILGIPSSALETVKPSQNLSIDMIKVLKMLLSPNFIRYKKTTPDYIYKPKL